MQKSIETEYSKEEWMKYHRFINVAIVLLAMMGLFWVGCSDDDTISPNTYTAPDDLATTLSTDVEEDNPYGEDWQGIEIDQDIDSTVIWNELYDENDWIILDPKDKEDPGDYDPNDPKDPGGTT